MRAARAIAQAEAAGTISPGSGDHHLPELDDCGHEAMRFWQWMGRRMDWFALVTLARLRGCSDFAMLVELLVAIDGAIGHVDR